MAPRPSIEQWLHAGDAQDVELPSGVTVRQKGASLAEFIRAGRIPNPLLPLAVKVEYAGLDMKDFGEEDARALEELKDIVIALSVKEPVITLEQASKLSGADRVWLWQNALHGLMSSFRGLRPKPGSDAPVGDSPEPERPSSYARED